MPSKKAAKSAKKPGLFERLQAKGKGMMDAKRQEVSDAKRKRIDEAVYGKPSKKKGRP